MKMKTRPYVLKIAIPNIVRFAIDEVRARNPHRLDEDLLGDVVSRGVKDMLDDAEETEVTSVVAFPIAAEVHARLTEFLGVDGADADERERVMAKLFELGLNAAIDEQLDLLKEPSDPLSAAASRKVEARRRLGVVR